MPYQLDQLPQIIEALLPSLNIAVIYSGDHRRDGAVLNRTYHPRFWKSYRKVAEHIQTTLMDLGFRNVFLLSDDMNLQQALIEKNIHLAWLNTGGVQGRNAMSHTPGLLEMLGVPYIGHSPHNYAVLDQKVSLKRLARSFGLATPDFMVWDPVYHSQPDVFLKSLRETLSETGGFVVKPVTGRASQYTHVIERTQDLLDAIHGIHQQTNNQVLIEKYLPGREFCVSGAPPFMHQNGAFHHLSQPFTFSYVERLFRNGERIFTSIDKVALDHSRATLLDEEKEADLISKLSGICQFVFREMGLKYLIRLDLRVDDKGVLNILEINPKPDLKRPENGKFSLVAMGLEKQGLTYDDLILGLLGSFLDFSLTHRPVSVPGILQILTRAGLSFNFKVADRPENIILSQGTDVT